jgi:hypothetical protein
VEGVKVLPLFGGLACKLDLCVNRIHLILKINYFGHIADRCKHDRQSTEAAWSQKSSRLGSDTVIGQELI